MLFHVPHKMAFTSTSPAVMIYKGAKPFYYKTRENAKNGIIELNMPEGDFYLLDGSFERTKPFIKYDFVNRYEKDFPHADIPEFDIIVQPNENKCSIDLFAKPRPKVYLDPSLRDVPENEISYVIGHEYSHNVFRGRGQESEEACDFMSFEAMLIYGFNPCQCVAAVDSVLSDRPSSCIRKTNAYYEMKKLD